MSVSVMGHMRPRVFHPREVLLGPPQAIMTERLKFSAKLRHKKAIRARFVPGPPTLISELEGYGRALFTRFGLNGYARFDFRLDEGGAPFLIDVNVNPNLERSEDFALSARRAGYSYEELICELIQDARKYRPQI
jgi:D-alanine-D-alanine ligase